VWRRTRSKSFRGVHVIESAGSLLNCRRIVTQKLSHDAALFPLSFSSRCIDFRNIPDGPIGALAYRVYTC
jgi:hypothetical protein